MKTVIRSPKSKKLLESLSKNIRMKVLAESLKKDLQNSKRSQDQKDSPKS